MSHRVTSRVLGSALASVGVYFSLWPLLWGLHFLVVPHLWCPEHEALERASEVQHASATSTAPGGALFGDLGSSSEGPHLVCPLDAKLLKDSQRPRRPVDLWQSLERAHGTGTLHATFERGRHSALSYAPKLSPPALPAALQSSAPTVYFGAC